MPECPPCRYAIGSGDSSSSLLLASKSLKEMRDDGVGENVHRRTRGRIGRQRRVTPGMQAAARDCNRIVRARRARMLTSRACRRERSTTTLLGGRAPAAFLRRFWQKEALLVRGAMPGFAGVVHARRAVRRSPARDDVESRLVVRDGGRWSLEHGPFRRARLQALPARDWTLLVQGVESAFATPPTRCCAASRSSRTRASTT